MVFLDYGKNNCNIGYAFINFVDLEHVEQFYKEMHRKKWDKILSHKVKAKGNFMGLLCGLGGGRSVKLSTLEFKG